MCHVVFIVLVVLVFIMLMSVAEVLSHRHDSTQRDNDAVRTFGQLNSRQPDRDMCSTSKRRLPQHVYFG